LAQCFDAAAFAIVPELKLRITKPSSEELVEPIRDATAIVHFQTRLNASILACPRLRIVVFLGACAVGHRFFAPGEEMVAILMIQRASST
jgi:hypothetical protein